MKTKKIHSLFIYWVLILLGVAQCKSKIQLASSNIANSTPMDSSIITPSWISMMDDPKVNYFKAVEAFDKFWENKERPTEKDGEGIDIYEKNKPEEGLKKEESKSVKYVYEYKQFLNWKERNKDLVKPDGTIMSPQEIIEQSKKAR